MNGFVYPPVKGEIVLVIRKAKLRDADGTLSRGLNNAGLNGEGTERGELASPQGDQGGRWWDRNFGSGSRD